MRFSTLCCVVAFCAFSTGSAFGQGGGMGAGAAYNAHQNQPVASYQNSQANHSELVAVKGTAELSIKPELLRLVFAVTSENETSQGCAAATAASILKIREGMKPLRVDQDKVVEDFIVVVPKYRWTLTKLRDEDVVKEVKDGFRMQTNLHVLCNDERQAMAVINVAFQAGVTEIVSFDYTHSQLDQFKRTALKQALEEAKSKSDILLTVFDQKPKVLNVDHSITVSFPESLYKTISPTPALEEALIPYAWRNKYLKIRANRPLTTFYQGNKAYSDLSPKRPAMNPEISIQSTVTLTYGSPARSERLEIERLNAITQNKK